MTVNPIILDLSGPKQVTNQNIVNMQRRKTHSMTIGCGRDDQCSNPGHESDLDDDVGTYFGANATT